MNDKKAPSLVKDFLNKTIESELENRVMHFTRKGFAKNFNAWLRNEEDLSAENMMKHIKDSDLFAANDALVQLADFWKDKKLGKGGKKDKK